jgi:hypothetical protein
MIRKVVRLTVLYLVAMFCAVSAAQAQCNSSNCQIILSGTGLPATPNPPCTPWGLWVWSQPSTNNSYGNSGQGSMYFYSIVGGLAPVEVSNVVLSRNSVSESASGKLPNGQSISCDLTAHQTSPGHGILDTMSCTIGAQSCSANDLPITVDISNSK